MHVRPLAMVDGLAVYRIGRGRPLLLFPYPHASTMRPMAEDLLADLLMGMGREVVTFDPPGAYRSTRAARCDMTEMLGCAAEALQAARTGQQAGAPVDVVGHSMGGLCALGLAVERPDLVERLVLVGACAGFPAVLRWSTPHNWSPWRDREWWQCVWWGSRQMLGLGNLAVHKKLDNLTARASVLDESLVQLWTIEPGDHRRPAPARSRWLRTVRRVDYADRLDQVSASTSVLVGRHDPQTPLPCAQQLVAGIRASRLTVFDHSGHAPFLEEPERFTAVVGDAIGRG